MHIIDYHIFLSHADLTNLTENASLHSRFPPGCVHSALPTSCEPTRYESVGCDDENFSSPKEYEANGEVIRCSLLREIREILREN